MPAKAAAPTTDDDLRQKILTDPLYKRAYLGAKGRKSFRFFCREILGYADMNAEHDALCEFLQYEEAPMRLVLMPRFTFKSSIATIGLTLWELANDADGRHLFYSDATEKAQGFLGGVKAHITGGIPNSIFRAIYGDWSVNPKQNTWNLEAIVIKPRRRAAVEATIETAGLETSKTGKHYDRLHFDDIVSDKNVTTKELMDKVEDVIKNADALIKRSGRTDFIGTRWHFGDAYGRMLAKMPDRKQLAIFHRKGHEGTKLYFSDIGKESLTADRIEDLKNRWGSYKFSCLIQNEPVDDETAMFKMADFTFYDPQRIRRTNGMTLLDDAQLFVTCCLDPIPPHEGTSGDDAALTVVGTDDQLNMYILDLVIGRMQPSEQIDELFRLHQKWTINVFGVETNSFQKVMHRDIEYRYKDERKDNRDFRLFSIREFKGASQVNKEQRIRGLQPYHERGALRFPGKSVETLKGSFYDLAYQLIQFPKSAKDDISDSLAYHVDIHRAGEKGLRPTVIPETSAAWFELEQMKEDLAEMQRRPRYQRRPLPELSFS